MYKNYDTARKLVLLVQNLQENIFKTKKVVLNAFPKSTTKSTSTVEQRYTIQYGTGILNTAQVR